MVASRTGSAAWKKLRAKAIAHALDEGLTNCPECGRWIDYDGPGRRPNSPELDHTEPYADSGIAVPRIEDVQIICQACNQAKGGHLGAQKAKKAEKALRTSQKW